MFVTVSDLTMPEDALLEELTGERVPADAKGSWFAVRDQYSKGQAEGLRFEAHADGCPWITRPRRLDEPRNGDTGARVRRDEFWHGWVPSLEHLAAYLWSDAEYPTYGGDVIEEHHPFHGYASSIVGHECAAGLRVTNEHHPYAPVPAELAKPRVNVTAARQEGHVHTYELAAALNAMLSPGGAVPTMATEVLVELGTHLVFAGPQDVRDAADVLAVALLRELERQSGMQLTGIGE